MTIFTKYKMVHETYAWQWKNGTQRVCSMPPFKGPIWEKAKKVFSDNPQGGHIPLDGL